MSGREKWGTKIPRSGGGLRDHLFESLERLRDGHIEVEEATATAALSNAIVKTVETQLKYETLLIKGDVSRNLSDLGVLEAPNEKQALPAPKVGGDGTAPSTAAVAAPIKPAAAPKKAA